MSCTSAPTSRTCATIARCKGRTRVAYRLLDGRLYATCRGCGAGDATADSPITEYPDGAGACYLCDGVGIVPPGEGSLISGRRWSERDGGVIVARRYVCEQHQAVFESYAFTYTSQGPVRRRFRRRKQ